MDFSSLPNIVKKNIKKVSTPQAEVFYVCAVNNPDVFWTNAGLSCFDESGKNIDGHWAPVVNSPDFKGMGEKYDYGFKVLSDRFKMKDNDIVVFLHEDLKFDRKTAEDTLRKIFLDNPRLGVVGVYGTELWQGGGWWTTARSVFSHGQIIQHNNGKCFKMEDNSGVFDNLVCVDGCFLCSTVRNVKAVGWRGNVSGWHQYDNDFCFRTLVETDNLVGVCELLVEHLSEGPLNDEWMRQSYKLIEWFKGLGIELPITKDRIYGWKEQRKKA